MPSSNLCELGRKISISVGDTSQGGLKLTKTLAIRFGKEAQNSMETHFTLNGPDDSNFHVEKKGNSYSVGAFAEGVPGEMWIGGEDNALVERETQQEASWQGIEEGTEEWNDLYEEIERRIYRPANEAEINIEMTLEQGEYTEHIEDDESNIVGEEKIPYVHLTYELFSKYGYDDGKSRGWYEEWLWTEQEVKNAISDMKRHIEYMTI